LDDCRQRSQELSRPKTPHSPPPSSTCPKKAKGILKAEEITNAATMKKRLRELTFLHETNQLVTATLDLETILRSLMAQLRSYFQVEAASVALLDEESNELIFRIAVGKAAEEVIGLHLAPGEGIAGWVAQTGKTCMVTNAYEDERFYDGIDQSTDFQTKTLLAVPITVEGQSIGVIEALNPPSGDFDKDAVWLMHAVADTAAAAIRNAELHERVQKTEQRYESLFQESSDPILVVDMEGKILDLNRQAVSLIEEPQAQLIGASPYQIFNLPYTHDEILQELSHDEQINLKMEIKTPENPRILETYLTTIDYGGREAIQWIGHDITQQVELEQIRDDLTHMIIHDLRNPLGTILSSLNMLQNAIQKRDETLPMAEVIDIATRSSKKLNRLIDSLLDIRRLETGEATLEKTHTSPRALAEEAMEQVQPIILYKEQQLNHYIEPDLPLLQADPEMIIRVLINLLDNAAKFTPTGGEISLSVRKKGSYIQFVVSDTGPGIAKKHHRHIFERFTRLRTTNEKGSGLGLAFCKLAVEAHNGSIWVKSKQNQGATFYFTLPLEAV
jgi:PAS domain S-box-containing protein